jgi:hypothetical protein
MFSTLCLLAGLAVTPITGWTQQAAADPLTGTWVGDWGPNANDRNQVRVDLKWDGKALTGVVHSVRPARPDVTLQKATYTASTGSVHLEAEATNPRSGAAVHYVIEGKLANGAMTGSWNHDATKGDFKLAHDVLSGTWTGDWGPSTNPNDRNQVSLELKADGKAVTGAVTSVRPARPEVVLKNSTFDAATGAIHMEADATNPRSGAAVHYVIEGKLANGVITGSWNHDATKGDFKLTKK